MAVKRLERECGRGFSYNSDISVLEQYYQKHPQEKRYVFDSDMEFTTDEGLRFSTDEDFC